MADNLAGDATVVERFYREARSMARLSDPHIAQIFLVGEDQGSPFFAMEYIEGESLSQRLRREQKLDPSTAAGLLLQIAQGLATAHDHGVIHRDLKPGNLLINRRGLVKIVDFGIALAAQEAQHKLTGTGQFVGTPGYLSPEVCLGQAVGQRSDIFALGIVYFEMLTGRSPFRDESPLGMLLEVVKAEIPDVRELEAGIDGRYAEILKRMVAKEPEQRYPDCHALIADLRAAGVQPMVAVTPTPAPTAAPLPPDAAGQGPATGASVVPPAPPTAPSAAPPASLPAAASKRALPWRTLVAAGLVACVIGVALCGTMVGPAPPKAGVEVSADRAPATATATTVAADAPPGSGSAALNWTPFVEPYDQIFPSVEIATATLPADPELYSEATVGDQLGLIGVWLEGVQAGTSFELSIRIPGLAAESRLSGELPDAEPPFRLAPQIAWDFVALAEIEQPRPASLEFELKVGGYPPVRQTQRVGVRSVNDALYFVDDDDDDYDQTYSWMFAAYVNEHHPLIDELLQEALDAGVVDTFDGYQSGDPDRALRQVYAIWHVLSSRGIRYSSITRTADDHPQLYSQHVRFIDQSIALTQANCVDGSVLIASALRKIDLDPVLVLLPDHMLLGVALDPEGEQMVWLESTMLGSAVDEDPSERIDQWPGAESETLAAFEAALAVGDEQVDAAGDAFDDPVDPTHELIDIAYERASGVMPITR